MNTEPPVLLNYGAESEPTKRSALAIASVSIGPIFLFWSILDTPLPTRIHYIIGVIGSLIGIDLGWAAIRQSNRKRSLAIIGICLCSLSFIVNALFPSW